MSEEQKRQLQQQLWNIANTLRGKMDADEFRDYILGFIFYKYLSEKIHFTANKILSDSGEDIDYTNVDENSESGKEIVNAIYEEVVEDLGYFLKPSELFSNIAKKGHQKEEGKSNFILPELSKILTNIEQSTLGTNSEDDFEGLFDDLDLTSAKLGRTEDEKNTLISKVLYHLDDIDFNLSDTNADVLGDAYEYLIAQFASGAGKKAGEFYTPQQVSTILARIVTSRKSQLKSVYDPTCGSGSLLLRVAREAKVSDFYGQEMNRTTYNLARMNMILHGVNYSNFDIRQEDTLEKPQHLDKTFDAIVANPPFSAKWSANELHLLDERFSQYGKLAPSSKADFAFIQHMIHHLDENGIMAVVMPHGVLFRGAAELVIRKYLIKEKNYLDAVIGLPANIFFGTSIPTCILIFKKCREADEDILFIDASKEFEKQKNQNVLLNEHIDKIVDTYQNRTVIEKFSHKATLQEVADNDYNLNIPRYVDTFEEEEEIDIQAVMAEIKELEAKRSQLDSEIEVYLKELGLVS
ncbi:MAG: type I restriction-modification system subunit M [Flavobacterium sp. 38-13]|uniref:type I restriction-modification system subunit M n=1 Tax=Flavobacterium sp. 38-13 TaxID=1896168 RepID=UPI0009637B3A|nr:type I restriction-modification system subunit M [Flavobacterium sp. 38-13]OJX54487.1 MAG: type I restriction-modification system subunit M [Flavobacterium sp. 38-13]